MYADRFCDGSLIAPGAPGESGSPSRPGQREVLEPGMSEEEAHASCEPDWEWCTKRGADSARTMGYNKNDIDDICEGLYRQCVRARTRGEWFDWQTELRRAFTKVGRQEAEKGQDRSPIITIPFGPFPIPIPIRLPGTGSGGLLGGLGRCQ